MAMEQEAAAVAEKEIVALAVTSDLMMAAAVRVVVAMEDTSEKVEADAEVSRGEMGAEEA